MNIPIDYNKMQAELDKRHYMSQVYISNIETWKPTQLGLKTYGKWCDLVGWENLHQEIGWGSTDDFMNLAIKRKWVERYYSFEEKQNVCSPTKFGHDLFRTFEYWIDEKAQKKVARKKQINNVVKEGGKLVQMIPKILAGISQFMGNSSEQEKPTKKTKMRKKKKTTKKTNKKSSDTTNVNNPSWDNWSNSTRKGNWWEV
jgi:hypothetical protein